MSDIMVLGKPYKINYLPSNQLPMNMGTSNRGRQVLCIDETLAPEQRDDTILHEILHVIDGELALGLSEETIQRLAVGITSAGYHRA
jgi:hypothetical protein